MRAMTTPVRAVHDVVGLLEVIGPTVRPLHVMLPIPTGKGPFRLFASVVIQSRS